MISLYDLLEASQGQLIGETGARLFNDFALDPRLAGDGNLAVAITGDDGEDGHAGLEEAVRRGATGILCSRPPQFDTHGVTVVLVRDTAAAMMAWSHYALGRSGAQVIGVAGVSGKSATVEAMRRVLSTRYTVHSDNPASSAVYGGRLHIPLTLARLTPRDQFVIVKLEANRPGEMAEIVGAVRPHVGAVLHIGEYAREPFASPDQYAAEMASLFDYLSPTGLALFNHDDDRARALANRTRAGTISVGVESFGADLTAYNIVLDVLRTGFDLRFGDARHVGRWTPVLGAHSLPSVLAGIAVGLYYDVPMADALHAITEIEPLPGRMRPLTGANGTLIIDDTYNAGPESTLALLSWLRSVTDGQRRTVFVLGDLDALGQGSSRAHRQIGQRAAEFAAHLVTEGMEAAGAGRAAADAGMPLGQIAITYSAADAADAVHAIETGERDVIAITGGLRARLERITTRLLAAPEGRALLPRAQLLDADPGGALRLLTERPSWVEIDLDALAHNVRGVKSLVGPNVTLFAVVKADAYGHGAVAVARTALRSGAEHLAVASVAEAMILRDAGISAPILVMSYTPVSAVRTAVRAGLTVTVYDLELARAYDRIAREMNERLRVHVKIDTGMGRLGVMPEDVYALFQGLGGLFALKVEGIYTHFSSADDDAEYTAAQVALFRRLVTPLQRAGWNPRYLHVCNSAGTLAYPAYHFNAVRVGIALYGIAPGEAVPVPADFRPVMAWKTRIAQVKTLPPGHPVGYGNTYRAAARERVAVIPVGYADGLRRGPVHWGEVLVRGVRAPILGRVSMEKTVIRVEHIPDAAIGDEVVLLGAQGGERITAEAVGARLGTIGYEVVTGVLARVSRS
jgi:alanine racemase